MFLPALEIYVVVVKVFICVEFCCCFLPLVILHATVFGLSGEGAFGARLT